MAEWVIEIRLGRRADASPVRRSIVEAPDEVEALKALLEQIEAEGGQPGGDLLVEGQEEVFARSEVASGRIEHHAGDEPGRPLRGTADAGDG